MTKAEFQDWINVLQTYCDKCEDAAIFVRVKHNEIMPVKAMQTGVALDRRSQAVIVWSALEIRPEESEGTLDWDKQVDPEEQG